MDRIPTTVFFRSAGQRPHLDLLGMGSKVTDNHWIPQYDYSVSPLEFMHWMCIRSGIWSGILVSNLHKGPRQPNDERNDLDLDSSTIFGHRFINEWSISAVLWTPGTFSWKYHLWSVLWSFKRNFTISWVDSRSLSVFIYPSCGSIPWWKEYPFFQATIHPPRGNSDDAPSYDSECLRYSVCLSIQLVSCSSILPLISSVLWRDLLLEIQKFPLTL